MTSLRSWFVPAVVLVMAAFATPALAQDDGKITVSVNFGGQAGSGDFTQSLTPTVYNETAQINVAQHYSSGALFDVGGSYLLGDKWGVSVAYDHTSGHGNAVLTGQIPDPLYFDQPRAVSLNVNDLNHVENAVHVDFVYRWVASPKIDVTLGIGPTFFNLKQDFVTQVNVAETVTSQPFVNPTVTAVTSTVSKSPVGFNFTADATYMVTKMIGAGVLIRYAHANPSLDVPNTSTPIDVKAGGFQIGGGVRVRF